MGAPLKETNCGVCQKAMLQSCGWSRSSRASWSRSIGEPFQVCIGTLDSLKAETAGRLRTTKSLVPHTISSVSSMKVSREEEGALRKRMSRLLRGVQKVVRSLLPEKRREDSSSMRVQTALMSALRRECRWEMTLLSKKRMSLVLNSV